MQFSAAKGFAENKLIQAQVFKEDGAVKDFGRFKKDAQEITDITQETWLRTEYDMARTQASQAEAFDRQNDDRDINPYWIYRGVMDDREREEHVELEGQIFKFGDPDADDFYPPLDWNCRCQAEPGDDDDIDKLGGINNVNTNAEAHELLESHCDPQFRYNPSIQGMMPNNGSYFEIMPPISDIDAEMFSFLDPVDDDRDLFGASNYMHERYYNKATGLHEMMNIVDGWRDKFHVKHEDIIFQNKQTRTNVKFTTQSLHACSKHPKGFNILPKVVENPDEIWSEWGDEKQRRVLRTYIKFGKTCYIVKTNNGEITDAMALSPGAAKKMRKGLVLLVK